MCVSVCVCACACVVVLYYFFVLNNFSFLSAWLEYKGSFLLLAGTNAIIHQNVLCLRGTFYERLAIFENVSSFCSNLKY